jgi:methyl-accepting chemotaxis protein
VTISIANRILLGFLAIVILSIGLGAYALTQIADVRATTETMVTRDVSVLRQLLDIGNERRAMNESRQTALLRVVLQAGGRAVPPVEETITAWQRDIAAVEARLTQAQESAEQHRAVAVSPQREAAWGNVVAGLASSLATLRELRTQSDRQIAAIRAGDADAALALQAGVTAPEQGFDAALTDVNEALAEVIAIGQRRAGEVYEESRSATAIAIAIIALIGLLLAFLIRQSIVRPLGAFMGFVERVGHGDLSGERARAGSDEIGRLGAMLNGMVDGLGEIARRSRDATSNLNAATAEIRASAQEQAASVEQQLAAVQETAATVDQITHSGSQIGKRAQEVIAAAQATARTSQSGLQAVEDTTRAMDAIRDQAEAVAETIVALSEKTQAIGEIISTVNDVSERSHLLALNAAIEAATAGEAGRGFAIVAAEMKTLADQAKDATVQVRAILGDIQRGINASVMLTEEAVKRVSAGRDRADITERTIREITSRVQESVQTFQQIVASTNQQQLGIEQVMSALQNIRQASQQTAAGTRQLDSAASNLGELSQEMLALSERYRL